MNFEIKHGIISINWHTQGSGKTALVYYNVRMDGLLEEFNDKIFNVLVEKIEIVQPRHFVFALKGWIRALLGL